MTDLVYFNPNGAKEIVAKIIEERDRYKAALEAIADTIKGDQDKCWTYAEQALGRKTTMKVDA